MITQLIDSYREKKWKSKLLKQIAAISSEELDDLSLRGIYLIGHGRSGTTMLHDLVNLDANAVLLGESNLFLHFCRRRFVACFNEQHARNELLRSKSLFISNLDDSASAMSVIIELSKRWNRIGEKIAVHPAWEHRYYRRLIDFQTAMFFNSDYILPIRDPREVVVSFLKLQPHLSREQCIVSYALGLRTILEIYFQFPHCYLFPFPWLFDKEIVKNLLRTSKLEADIPEDLITRRNVNTKAIDSPEDLEPLVDVYNTIVDGVSRDTFRIAEGSLYNRRDQLARSLEEVVSRYMEPT